MLKQARLNRGMTLEEIENSTKIRKRYLQAIEEGNYKVLPGSFYSRAFIKSYAETVGLDPEEVLNLYHKENPSPNEYEPPAEPLVRSRKKVQHNDKFGKWATNLLMWAFPLLIVILVYLYLVNNTNPGQTNKVDDLTGDSGFVVPGPAEQNGEEPPSSGQDEGGDDGSTPPPDSGTETDPQQDEGTAGQDEGTEPGQDGGTDAEPESPVQVVFTGRSGSTYQYSVETSGAISLQLRVEGGDCWVEVRQGGRSGERLKYETMSDGDEFSFETEEPLYIKVGRADRANIAINGVVIDDGNGGTTRQMLFERANADDAAE
jgi:cytoskeleton protein RodZ